MSRIIFTNVFIMILSFSAHAQDADLLFSSQTAAPSKTVPADYTVPRVQTKKASSNKRCTSASQNSIPLIFILGMLKHKPAKLIPDEGKTNETISVKGNSPIIGNCISMVNPQVTWDEERKKYLYEVKINGCAQVDGKCEYEFTKKDPKTEQITSDKQSFAPTMAGYFKCLEASGALKDGKPVEAAIDRQELRSSPVPIVDSADLLFVSRGPSAVNEGGVYSQSNMIDNDDCDFYENIKKDGYKVVSKIEIDKNLLKTEFQALCDVANYEIIEQRLQNFKEFEGMFNVLSEVRNQLLLEEVKKVKKGFDKKSKAGKLNELDAEKYAKVMDDYYKYIVEPHFKENKDSANNSRLLINLVNKYEEATTDEEKKELKEKIQKATNELSKLMAPPYFSPGDYKKFVSVKRNAPVESPSWETASLKLQRSLVSIKMACEAYGTNSTCKRLRKDKNFSRKKNQLVDFDDVTDQVEVYAKKAEKTYAEMRRLVEDPDLDISSNYADSLAECTGADDDYDEYQTSIRGLTQQMAIQCQKTAKHNRILLKHCIEDGQAEIEDEEIYLEGKLCSDSEKSRLRKKVAEYRKKEKYRDDYLDSDDDDDDDDDDDSDNDGSGRRKRKSRNSSERVANNINQQQNGMQFAAGIPQMMQAGMMQLGQYGRPYQNGFTQQGGTGFNPQQYGYNPQYGSGYNPQQYGYGYQGMGRNQFMYGGPQRMPANFGYGNSGGLGFGFNAGYGGAMNYGRPGAMYTGTPGYTYGHSF